MQSSLALLLLGLVSTGAQVNQILRDTGGLSFTCPHEYGFYPHDSSCDKYWSCEASTATLKLCGNGLSFDATDAEFVTENCDYMQNVDCTGRPNREPAIPTTHCDYLFGIFPDPDDCQVFWSCWDGESSKYTCGPGLAYDRNSRICTWMDSIPECKQQRADLQQGFACPASGALVAKGSFTRHAHPDDCRQYYVCFDEVPREYGCPIGTVFQIGAQDGSGQCAEPQLVPGCEEYYGDLDLITLQKSQLLLANSGSQRRPSQSSGGSRNTRKGQTTSSDVVEQEVLPLA